ncbi:MAG: S8 family serine peptidase [Bacteriovorax sp.]|nr:S8 family serine peptidase [Bacteriovorax sp.]
MKKSLIIIVFLVTHMCVPLYASNLSYEQQFTGLEKNNPNFLSGQLNEVFDATRPDTVFGEIQKKLGLTNNQHTLVAVLEAGFFMEHPGFKGKLKFARDIVNGINDPSGARASRVAGKNNTWNPGSQGHGTHTLGIAIAGGGVIGMPILAFSSDGRINLVESVIYAIDNGARVINMSILNGTKGLLEIADSHPEILFVKAAGNAALSLDAQLDSAAANPDGAWGGFDPIVAYPRENVVVIAATDSSGKLWHQASGSNYGVRTVRLAARGADVLSYYPIDGFNGTTGKQMLTGTSMATPLVAGVAGRIFTIYPKLMASEVSKILEVTSFQTQELQSKVGSGGIIDPKSAYQLVALLKLTRDGMSFVNASLQIGLTTDEKSRYQALLKFF